MPRAFLACSVEAKYSTHELNVPKNYPTDPKDILIRVEESAEQGGKAFFQILHTFMGTLQLRRI